jgi:putative hydrolase of the HAD superfamily
LRLARTSAVFFDAGDTLIHKWVLKQDRFAWLYRQAGLPLPEDSALIAAGAAAQERFFQDRQKHADAWTEAWHIRMNVAGLTAMGLSGALAETAGRIKQVSDSLPDGRTVDPEALPVLQALRGQGCRLAIVSNWDGTLLDTVRESGLAGYFDAILDSAVVGSRKPEVTMFRLACEVTGVRPEEAMHVGDSPGADVAGALAAGVRPVLLDAMDIFPDGSLAGPVTRIRRLSDLLQVLG